MKVTNLLSATAILIETLSREIFDFLTANYRLQQI